VDSKGYKCLLISDFTIDNLAAYLNNDADSPQVKSNTASFGQVAQVLTDKNLDCWKDNPDFTVVWTQPERVITSFNHIINYKDVPIKKLLKEVDDYSSLLLNIRDRTRFIFVPAWVFPSYHRGFGMLEMKTGVGIANALMRMNLRLSENLDKAANIYLLNTQRWLTICGGNVFNPKLWYMGKIAFANEVFREAAKDIKSALRGISGNSRKLVILDLDETLWGGIAGEIGWENIKLGGHDPIGEAYLDFQRALKSLTNRGVLLGIVSKNEETVALEAINRHPEMILKLKDFVGWRINWQDKASNIVELARELNLGLQSVVFVDDSPVERARVREALPEVFVPEWPDDKMLYRSALLGLHCFDYPAISKEDLERNRMYLAERRRKEAKKEIGSPEEWLKSLKIEVRVKELGAAELPRAAQLLNKTNQMNLSTRRLTELELITWAKDKNHKLWVFRVRDKFGDSGLTGIISLAVNGRTGRIVDFVLSCRVIGRKIEEAMLQKAIGYAQGCGLQEVRAEYIPTAKNKPCLEFWRKSGFKLNKEDRSFIWKLNSNFTLPDYINVIQE